MVLQRTKCTVLLIDDERSGVELRKRVLESSGFKTLATTEIEVAMNLFQINDVDVVVTDHMLGRSTATAMATSMKRLKPHVPIISLSGTTDVDEALRYADHFVGKAEGPDKLISMLDKVLAEKSVRQDAPAVAPLSDTLDLSSAHALLAAIVEDSSDAILSKTLDGIVMSWNHSAEIMYGYTRDEMIGQPIAILLPEDRPDEVTHILSRLKRGERIFHFETVRIAKNGQKLDVALTISPIRDANGRLVGASTIARDISEQKKAEEALRKAEKLAVAGRMAATVAHEINNPLGAIGDILYLLRHSVELNAEARKYVDDAEEELRRVSEITKLMLGMQRGAADRRESIQLTKLLDNVLTLYERRARSLGIQIQRKYAYEGLIVGCPGELRQVFSNLIVNAMDAMAMAGRKLAVSVRRSHRWDTAQEGVRVNIFDDGSGIDPARRSQLFDAFYTTKGEQGTGIGLWVSRNLIKKHNGTVRVRSSVRPGHSGSCFSVFLPIGT